MSVASLSPGVRFEFSDAATRPGMPFRTDIAGLAGFADEFSDAATRPGMPFRTDIAGLVGFAERGPLHRPVLVESWQQYVTMFGGLSDLGYLSYAVRLFFDNGGRSVYVVRVAVPIIDDEIPVAQRAAVAAADLVLRDSLGTVHPLPVVATSVGRWGNGVHLDVEPERRRRATLRIREGRTTWRMADVSLDPADDRFLWNVIPYLEGEETKHPRVDTGAAPPPLALDVPPPHPASEVLEFIKLTDVWLRGGRDGVSAVTPSHMIGETDSEHRRFGLAALYDIDEVSIVAMPDASAFAVRDVEYGRPPTPDPCTLEITVEPSGAVYHVADAIRLTLLADKLGTTRDELRKWNPHLEGDVVPANTDIALPVTRSDRFPSSVQPLFAGSLLHVAERLHIVELARRLGTAPDDLRLANPGLQEFADVGDALRIPLSAGVVSAAEAGASGIGGASAPQDTDQLTPGRTETVNWLNTVSTRSGLNLGELMRANPAYRLATRTQPWRAPGAPIQIPVPPFEPPPQWDDAQSVKFANALIDFCERRRDCVALIDAPRSAGNPEDAIRYRSTFTSSFAAMYWPWLEVRLRGLDDAGQPGALNRQLITPASGAVAGALAAADREAGPHRTPAGRRIQSAVAAAYQLDDEEHGAINRQGVNAFRERPGRGVVLEGTRSLSRERALRYFNVRRTLIAILEVLDERSQWAVFEPNGPRLWLDLRDRITASLTYVWNRGWLLGNFPSQGFTVICDETTNPPVERDLGRVIAHVRLRIPPPIEWILVRIGQSGSGTEILSVEAV